MAGKTHEYLLQMKYKIFLFRQGFLDSVPVRWIFRYERNIALVFYMLWAAGCGYWIYWLVTIDTRPQVNLLHFDEPRDALIILFFGTLGSAYVFFVAIFLLKFVFNLVHGGINALFPGRLHSLSKSASCLIALYFAFFYGENIKAAGLTAYTHVAHIVRTSRQHDEMIEKNITDLNELLKDLNKEFPETSPEQ
jgi:hypothetical protein